MMKRYILSLPLAIVLLAKPVVSDAVVVVDQDNMLAIGFGSALFTGADNDGYGRAQTFTVGVSGILDSIEIQIAAPFGVPPPPWASIRILETLEGVPIGGAGGSSVLAISTIAPEPDPTDFLVFRFDLHEAGLRVDVGDVLAIEPTTDPFTAPGWRQSESYAGGTSVFFSTELGVSSWTTRGFDVDFAFRTFVDTSRQVPEPATLALVGLALAGYRLSRLAWPTPKRSK